MKRLRPYLTPLIAAVYIFSTVVLFHRLSDTNRALSSNVNAQVTNRARNVQAWCGGINAGRDYDRAFIRRVTHGRLQYTLHDLDCKALVAKTLKSAQHH